MEVVQESFFRKCTLSISKLDRNRLNGHPLTDRADIRFLTVVSVKAKEITEQTVCILALLFLIKKKRKIYRQQRRV